MRPNPSANLNNVIHLKTGTTDPLSLGELMRGGFAPKFAYAIAALARGFAGGTPPALPGTQNLPLKAHKREKGSADCDSYLVSSVRARFANRASLSESGFTGLAVFSGFRFARLAIFAITENPAKTNADKRLPIKDARQKNPVNPDSDKAQYPRGQGNRILSILEYLTQLNIAKIDNSLGKSEFIG